MHPDVRLRRVTQLAKQRHNPIHEWLASDQTHIRVTHRLVNKVLTGAKSDFQPHRTLAAEQGHKVNPPRSGKMTGAQPRHSDGLQRLFKQPLLAGPQSFAAPAAIEISCGPGRIHRLF